MFSLGSSPIVLGLGESVSKGVLVLGPILVGIGSTLEVEVGVIFEDSGLGDVSGIVVGLTLDLSLADFVVLLGSQSRWDIRFARGDLSKSQLFTFIIEKKKCYVRY